MAKRKVQKDKQRYTKHTSKTKDRVARTPLKPEVPAQRPYSPFDVLKRRFQLGHQICQGFP